MIPTLGRTQRAVSDLLVHSKKSSYRCLMELLRPALISLLTMSIVSLQRQQKTVSFCGQFGQPHSLTDVAGLTLNVWAPAGLAAGSKLPVAAVRFIFPWKACRLFSHYL